MRALLAALSLCLVPLCVEAKPSRYGAVTEFIGDRYGSPRIAQGMSAAEVARAAKRKAGAKARHPMKYREPRKRPPGSVAPLAKFKSNIYRGFVAEIAKALPSRTLAGVTAPLANKAREIMAACGSKVISGVRHTRIAGTGGRLSLHASGRAVDMKGNPSCIMAHLKDWPGGVSVDYAAVNHTHISFAPGGPEWGVRFRHFRGGKRSRYARRRA